MNPVLLDFPEQWQTQRLSIRAVRPGEGQLVNDAIRASWPELRQWMPWAKTLPSVAESEEFPRLALAKFHTREELNFRLWLRASGEFVGAMGLHHIDWSIPHFEIGYWLHSELTGRGYMSEAVGSLAGFAFEHLQARRLEIRCDTRNHRSAEVAQRTGFTLEGILRQSARDNEGALRDTCIYALIR